MRILSFTKDWVKLEHDEFTTFRTERGDRDWVVGELVQVRVGARRPGGGRRCGLARIIAKERKESESDITEEEAIADGFETREEMAAWLRGANKSNVFQGRLFKYTLRWTRVAEELPLEVEA